MAEVWQFLQGHPKSPFSKKVQRGNEEKFFKNRPKQPSFEWPKSKLPQMALSSKQYAFKLQRLENVLIQTAAPKVAERPSYGNFRKVIQNPHFLISMQLKCKDWRRFWRKSGSKSARIAKVWQFSQGHPKPAFSEKVQRGDQRKFFKNRPKSSLRLKGLKALWRKLNYTSIKMHLK